MAKVGKRLAALIAKEPPGKRTVPFKDFGCVLASASNHRPTPAISQLHHVLPLFLLKRIPESAMFSVDFDLDERVPLCSSHHLDGHIALDSMLKNKPTPPGIGRAEKALAQEAIRRFKAAGGE